MSAADTKRPARLADAGNGMPPDGDTTRRDVTRIALLGLNAWAVALAIPVLHAAGGSTAARVAALLGPLVALALGALATLVWRRRRAAAATN